jgi:hypothetical protein
MKVLIPFLLVIALGTGGCAAVPVNLTPEATTAFQHNQIEKALDLVRDIAQTGAGLKPPVFTVAGARTVTKWHEAAIKVLYASSTGWKAIVLTSLSQLPLLLSPTDLAQVSPYVELARTLLSQVN